MDYKLQLFFKDFCGVAYSLCGLYKEFTVNHTQLNQFPKRTVWKILWYNDNFVTQPTYITFVFCSAVYSAVWLVYEFFSEKVQKITGAAYITVQFIVRNLWY